MEPNFKRTPHGLDRRWIRCEQVTESGQPLSKWNFEPAAADTDAAFRPRPETVSERAEVHVQQKPLAAALSNSRAVIVISLLVTLCTTATLLSALPASD